MQAYKEGPAVGWAKIDKAVLKDPDLSPGAKVLYCNLCGLKQGGILSEENFYSSLGLSRATYYRQKKELMDSGLVHMEQLGPRNYKIYVGHSKTRGEEVKARLNLMTKGNK